MLTPRACSRLLQVWAVLPMAAVVLARLAGPMNVDDTDQSKQALYLLDVMEHGNWVLPMERGVEPATKPPVLTWIAAAFCATVGGPSYPVARGVSGLSALLMAWLIFKIASERWTPAVGLVSAWILAASQPVVLLCTHFRTDMLLAVSLTGTLFALHRMERRGVDRRMAWLFWATVSFAVFVKGPPGLLVLLGTAAVLLFSRRWRTLFSGIVRSPGGVLLLVPIGWFLLAYGVGGNPYVKFTVVRETFDRVTGTGTRAGSVRHPPGYLFVHFLAKGAPWSILALAAVVVSVSRQVDPEARAKLHLFAAWLVGPMILFNLSKGQRPDYLLPMLPAASAMAASLLLDPAARRSAALWKGAVGLFAIAAGALSLSALTGTTFGRVVLRGFAEDGGRLWALGLGMSALLAAAGLWRRGETGMLVAIVAFLAAHLIYAGTVAPGSAARRGEALVEFSDAVRKERRPGDELHIYGRSITNGVHYYLDLNEPAVPTQLLSGLMRQRRPGRLLLATNHAGSSELQQQWPGRFEVLATLRQGRKTDAEHVLLGSRQ